MVKKNTISPLLRADFGVEDFVSGAHKNYGALSLEDVSLSNALGLLAPLADKADTSTESFAMSAEAYLGESQSIGIMADHVLAGINQRFATGVEISKMGVEGFDPFAYGMEGFGESVKNFFKMIAAAFKKLIQTVSNFIRSVMNFIRGQIAKTQTKYWTDNKDKIKNMTDESKGKLIKVRLPVSDTATICKSFWEPLKDYNDYTSFLISAANENYEKGTMRDKNYFYLGVAKGQQGTVKESKDQVFMNLKFKTKKGEVGISEKTKSSDVAEYLVFGENKKKEMRPAVFLKTVNIESFLKMPSEL